MKKITDSLRREISGWKWWELLYLVLCTGAIGAVSVSLGDTGWGITSAVAGTLYTLLAGKGKISCYFFGVVNCAIYGYLAYSQKLFGDAMLNWCWYLPMMFVGIFCWRSKLDEQNCIIKNSLSWRSRGVLLLFCAFGISLYALILHRLGGSQPAVDSTTTVLSVAAMILTVKRCVEQWLMWCVVNAVSTVMWVRVVMRSGEGVATLLWWSIMLITGIIFFIQWLLDMKKQEKIS